MGTNMIKKFVQKFGSLDKFLVFFRKLKPKDVENNPSPDFFTYLQKKSGINVIFDTIDVIGGGEKTIEFLSYLNYAFFTDFTHLMKHIGKEDVKQLVKGAGSVKKVLSFMALLDLSGSMSGEYVHTFVSFIEASGGVSKICELYPENANGVAQKIGHLLTHTSVSSMTICIKIFGRPLNVVYFMEAIGGVHKMLVFMKTFTPIDIRLLLRLYGSIDNLVKEVVSVIRST